MAPGVGSGPGRVLKIRTFGVAGSTSQEAVEEVEEGCDTISETHDIEEMDCHESWLACLVRWSDKGWGESTLLNVSLFC